MLVCVIDRSKWARRTVGSNKGISLLINKQGNMCCLGFLGLTCEIPESALFEKVSPAELVELNEKEGIKYPANVDWHKFISINDDRYTTDAEKEAKLIKLAQDNGFEFQFVGE